VTPQVRDPLALLHQLDLGDAKLVAFRQVLRGLIRQIRVPKRSVNGGIYDLVCHGVRPLWTFSLRRKWAANGISFEEVSKREPHR
jgi:hypothetical protein